MACGPRKDNARYDLKHLFLRTRAPSASSPPHHAEVVPAPPAGWPRCSRPCPACRRRWHCCRSCATPPRRRAGLQADLSNRRCNTAPRARRPQSAACGLALVRAVRPDHVSARGAEGVVAGALEVGLVTTRPLREARRRQQRCGCARPSPSRRSPRAPGVEPAILVPVSHIPHLVEAASNGAPKVIPGIRPVPLGHVGDGNLHFNFSQPVGHGRQSVPGARRECAWWCTTSPPPRAAGSAPSTASAWRSGPGAVVEVD